MNQWLIGQMGHWVSESVGHGSVVRYIRTGSRVWLVTHYKTIVFYIYYQIPKLSRFHIIINSKRPQTT